MTATTRPAKGQVWLDTQTDRHLKVLQVVPARGDKDAYAFVKECAASGEVFVRAPRLKIGYERFGSPGLRLVTP